MAIYVNGSVAYDRIMRFSGNFSDHILPEKIDILNVCFLIDSIDERLGGTAGNIAYSLKLLGESPTIQASVGKDFDRYEKVLVANGLSLEGITRFDDVFTAGAYITTDKNDNQITGFNPGAMNFACEYVFSSLDKQNDIGVIAPNFKGDMMRFSREYREAGVKYIFDPGQQIPVFTGDELLECISGAHILISNDYELEMIMKATGKTKAELLTLCDYIITTLGEGGSTVDNGTPVHVGIASVENVIDPTGAGDAYRAGLLKGLVEGKSVVEAAKMGAVCSSYCVEKLGTQEHLFSVEEFSARYTTAFGK